MTTLRDLARLLGHFGLAFFVGWVALLCFWHQPADYVQSPDLADAYGAIRLLAMAVPGAAVAMIVVHPKKNYRAWLSTWAVVFSIAFGWFAYN